jgi:uridylate kinase
MTLYRRVLLKISGEALASPDPFEVKPPIGISGTMLSKVAQDIKAVQEMGVEVAIVVGGGNIFRGLEGVNDHGLDRTTSDHMGMMATVINGLALQHALESTGIVSRLMSAIPMPTVCESYARRRALRHLEKGRVVVFASGTGNPYFTTDSAAALRASELNCDILAKATKVKGVYTQDPKKYADAQFLPKLSFDYAMQKRLNVMDAAAFALVRDNNIPIAVFSIYESSGFTNLVKGQGNFTIISNEE